jgi:D-alanyl-D-alanine carboxypeptidase/D-alanyl-D-alanine-endopeptidase (penicillin-binding protein 4)
MKKPFFAVIYLLFFACSFAQSMSQKIEKVYQQFEADSQLRHAISSLYIINAKTGEMVFDRNSQVGLAPASTQKIVTATTAFELLTPKYKYQTDLAYSGKIEKGVLNGNLYVVGRGDPTLGSWRFPSTVDTIILNGWVKSVLQLKIKEISGDVVAVDNKFETQTTPDGWIWQDIGNYYGAGVMGLNWHENQYDLKLAPGSKEGDSVRILGTYPEIEYNYLINELKTGPKGSGDNGYIYFPPYGFNGFVRGTIPLGESPFIISGSFTMPSHYPVGYLGDRLKKNGIKIAGDWPETMIQYAAERQKAPYPDKIISTYYSPGLDSIIYWFLQKSINLYGEALLKTFAYEKKGFGSTDSGVAIVKDFWKQKGLDDDELNIMDGSGLSPQNRVTTHAQVEILRYAKTRDWFPYFYQALPIYNGMKMKSGSIRDVKGYCGYQQSADGNEYIFSFLVNNYTGRSSVVVNKMYRVLDVLK